MSFSAQDERLMRRALELAAKGIGNTAPNPRVGAVVARGERILGEGYHRYSAVAHAESVALKQAGARARGATLYVTLEPCNHHGRTPPCTDGIVAAGIKRVVAGVGDPNPIVSGRGFRRLRRAGVKVESSCLRAACEALNRPFFKAVRAGLPFVVAKMAQSLDGRTALRSGESQWITSEEARLAGQEMRLEADAILTGINTILGDDPLLTLRTGKKDRPLLRAILDTNLRIPLGARCLNVSEAPTVIFTARRAGTKLAVLRKAGVEVLPLNTSGGRLPLRSVLATLAQRERHSVLLEGGGTLLGSAFREGLVDRIACFTAPMLLGGDAQAAIDALGLRRLRDALRLENAEFRRCGRDWLISADVVYPSARARRRGMGH